MRPHPTVPQRKSWPIISLRVGATRAIAAFMPMISYASQYAPPLVFFIDND